MTGTVSQKSHVTSHHLYYSTYASPYTLTPLASSTFNNRVTQNGPLAVALDAYLQCGLAAIF